MSCKRHWVNFTRYQYFCPFGGPITEEYNDVFYGAARDKAEESKTNITESKVQVAFLKSGYTFGWNIWSLSYLD